MKILKPYSLLLALLIALSAFACDKTPRSPTALDPQPNTDANETILNQSDCPAIEGRERDRCP